jgi:hypothetical protein
MAYFFFSVQTGYHAIEVAIYDMISLRPEKLPLEKCCFDKKKAFAKWLPGNECIGQIFDMRSDTFFLKMLSKEQKNT